MKRKIDIYIEAVANSGDYSKIELFNDEEINVSSSIQNISDISKIFTDFSQSFTVPASRVNNAIFEHFYNNDVDTVLDHNLRRNAYIEIDYTPFRTGKIQLEKASIKNNQNDNYSITFYGQLLSLKDIFGEVKLKDLDYSLIDSAYSGTEVQDRITDTTDYDVRYPLITSKRLWTYGDATSTDISTTGGKLNYDELFPALKVVKIFEAIENYFSIDFTGVFIQTSKRFTNLFLYLKNKESFEVFTEAKAIDIIDYENYLDQFLGYELMDIVNDTVTLKESNFAASIIEASIELELVMYNVTDLTAHYYIDVYENGTLLTTIAGIGNNTYNVRTIDTTNGSGNIHVIKCILRANKGFNFDSYYNYIKFEEYNVPDVGYGTYDASSYWLTGYNANQTLSTSTIDLASFMPDITVSDFVSGIFKNFNLTCYPKTPTIFQVEPLDDWYTKGRILDITKHVTTEEIGIARIPLYKTIKFEHEQSQSFMNREFADLFGKEYGDLYNTYDYDGGDYTIKVPFENLLHSEFDGTMTQVGFCLTKEPDFKPYIPKPILLYMYDQQSTDIKFFDGTTTNTITTYMPFGQDMKDLSTNYSLNWGSDNSSLLNVPIQNGKFKTYYYGYLSNLFNKKNRLTTVRTILPISLLSTLKLNDRLIIRDKRYIINQMNSKLTTGEVNLELINDFRAIRKQLVIATGKGSGTAKMPILFQNFTKSASISTTASGVTITPSTLTSEDEVEITYSADTNVYYNRITEDGNNRVTETFLDRITEQGNDNIIPIKIDYESENGDTETVYQYLIQKQ